MRVIRFLRVLRTCSTTCPRAASPSHRSTLLFPGPIVVPSCASLSHHRTHYHGTISRVPNRAPTKLASGGPVFRGDGPATGAPSFHRSTIVRTIVGLLPVGSPIVVPFYASPSHYSILLYFLGFPNRSTPTKLASGGAVPFLRGDGPATGAPLWRKIGCAAERASGGTPL